MSKQEFIGVGSQCVDAEDVAFVGAMLQDDFLTQGPQLKAFEQSLMDFTQAPFASVVSSGSAALHIACKIFGAHEKTEMFTPAITFASSQNAVLHFGGRVVFVDVDAHSANMDMNCLEEALKKSKAKHKIIMPVHFAGLACDLSEISGLAAKYGAHVIEDASHALGSKYQGKYIGAVHPCHIVTLSFHPLKHITTGEGGAILCGDEELWQKSNLLRSHGIDKKNQTTEDKGKLWHYEMTELGFNYRMSDINAALGVSQMQKLPQFLQRRKQLADVYSNELKALDVVLPSEEEGKEHAWLLYMLQLDFEKRGIDKQELMLALRKEGIGTQVHNIPVYRHPYFVKRYGDLKNQFPQSERFFKQTFSVPLHPSMSDSDQERVISALRKILN